MIRWGYMPPEVRDAFRPILLRYLWLAPSWCHTLSVAYRQLDSEGNAHVEAEYASSSEYRKGWITLYSGWLDSPPPERVATVVHELLHLPIAPMKGEHGDVIDTLCPKDESPKFHQHLREQARQRLEGTVQDLTAAILSLPEGTLPNVPFSEDEDEHPEPLDVREKKGGPRAA